MFRNLKRGKLPEMKSSWVISYVQHSPFLGTQTYVKNINNCLNFYFGAFSINETPTTKAVDNMKLQKKLSEGLCGRCIRHKL